MAASYFVAYAILNTLHELQEQAQFYLKGFFYKLFTIYI